MTAVRAALAAVLYVVVTCTSAAAHDERALHSLTVIDEISPQLDGVEIRVVHMGMPALAVRNLSDRVVTVLDEKGEPFLRIGPRGVFANVASATTYRSIDPESDVVPPDLGLKHGWAKFSNRSEWSWFDPRLVVREGASDWVVPMRVDGTSVTVAGGFESLHGHGHFVTRADVPEVAGLDIRLVQGPIPAVFVRNDTSETLHVTGREGEPFLQIGPDGVRANLMSPSYYAGGAQRIARVPAWADPAAPPRWKRVSGEPVWGWLDQRAALPAQMQQRSLLGPERRTVSTWSIDMSLGTRALPLTGTVEWVPPASAADEGAGDRSDLVRVTLIVLIVAAAVAFVVTSRRQPAAA